MKAKSLDLVLFGLVIIFLVSCSEELPPSPVPSPHEIGFFLKTGEDIQRNCLVGEYEITPREKIYTLHVPSSGGKFIISEFWKHNETGEVFSMDALKMTHIYSPINQKDIVFGDDFNAEDLEQSGILMEKNINETEVEIDFDSNTSNHELVYKAYFKAFSDALYHSGKWESDKKLIIVVWPQGSVADRYYSGELTFEETRNLMKEDFSFAEY